MFTKTVKSPLGAILLASDGRALTRCVPAGTQPPSEESDCPVLTEAARELDAYFAGHLRAFQTPIKPEGSAFDLRVWTQAQKIPYGETRSYAQLAADIGNHHACRAVGGALGRNPLLIFIPCHRVLGADGKLHGFAGGLAMKAFLLKTERYGI